MQKKTHEKRSTQEQYISKLMYNVCVVDWFMLAIKATKIRYYQLSRFCGMKKKDMSNEKHRQVKHIWILI